MIGTAYPHRGGIAHFNTLLFRTLQKRGHKVHMISFTRQYPSIFFPGKTQFEAKENPDLDIGAEPMLDSIGPISWFRVARRVREINPDLIIFKYWMPFFAPAFGTIARRAKARRNTKVLFICDNIIPHERRPGDRLLTRWAISSVDYFIVMSDAVKNDLLQFLPNANYRLVQHPVYEIFGKTYDKSEARSALNLPPDQRIVLFFGYIRRYKGLHVLLDAMAKLEPDLNVKLLVAGEFYDDRESYFRKIDELKLADRVIVADRYIPNEEVGLYYAAADVVALPYISATQSGIVQICYHYNKPVIATNVGGLPEVVHDGETGFVVPANDANAFADAIRRFYNEDREKEFSENVARAKEQFSWDRMAEAIEDMSSIQK